MQHTTRCRMQRISGTCSGSSAGMPCPSRLLRPSQASVWLHPRSVAMADSMRLARTPHPHPTRMWQVRRRLTMAEEAAATFGRAAARMQQEWLRPYDVLNVSWLRRLVPPLCASDSREYYLRGTAGSMHQTVTDRFVQNLPLCSIGTHLARMRTADSHTRCRAARGRSPRTGLRRLGSSPVSIRS
jgi:hypothetical protein